jgi:hypothetical protein
MKFIVGTILLILVSSLLNVIIAQVPPPPAPDIVPIDGGISLLLAMGAGYGAKSIYNSRKLKNASDPETEEL